MTGRCELLEEEEDIPGLDADMGKTERVECGEARKSHALLLVGAAVLEE